MKTKQIKTIKVDLDKCTGCRGCEMACAAFHATPRYSIMNPARARIRIVNNELRDVYVPVRAAEYTQAECSGRNRYMINKKMYDECDFCGASCPSRDFFKEPDSGLPLKCDMCEDDPPLEKPMCVQACVFGALTYEVREEPVAEETEAKKKQEIEAGLESLVKKHGAKAVRDTLGRIAKG